MKTARSNMKAIIREKNKITVRWKSERWVPAILHRNGLRCVGLSMGPLAVVGLTRQKRQVKITGQYNINMYWLQNDARSTWR